MTLETEPETNTYVLYQTQKSVDDHLSSFGFLSVTSVMLIYLAFVLKIGPDLMKNRKAFQLKNVLMAYNIFQVLLSIYLFILSAKVLCKTGLLPRRVPAEDPEILEMMASVTPIVMMSKLSELLDTIFFVLRKKFNQVSFLHVYHHAIMITGSWLYMMYGVNHSSTWATFINAIVHTLMYLYYLISAFGPEYQKYLFWKSYITTFQLVQFLTFLLHQTLSIIYTKGEYSIFGVAYLYINGIFFFYLFLNFYQQTYTKKKKK